MNTKSVTKLFFGFFAILLVTTGAFADSTITLINKFGQPLHFQIGGQNGNQFVPDFPTNFDLSTNNTIQSRVIAPPNNSPSACQGAQFNPNTFIRATLTANLTSNATANKKELPLINPFAFFATGLQCPNSQTPIETPKVGISGFMSTDIAFSWQEGQHAVVIFCKPENYPCH